MIIETIGPRIAGPPYLQVNCIKQTEDHSLGKLEELVSSHEKPDKVPKPLRPRQGFDDRTVPQPLGSYNGVVAILCNNKELIVWEPAAGKYKTFSWSCLGDTVDMNSLFGLCYDEAQDVYTAVVASAYGSPPSSPSSDDYSDNEQEHKASDAVATYVFNIKSRSLRKISNSSLCQKICRDETGTVVRGIPHWKMQDDIIYFDLQTEKFKQMQTPRGEKQLVGLGALCGQEKLGILLLSEGASYEVWVLRDYGKPETWTNLHTISPDLTGVMKESLDMPWEIGFIGNRILLVDGSHRGLWAYDSQEGSLSQIATWNYCHFGTIMAYQPGLSPTPQYDQLNKGKGIVPRRKQRKPKQAKKPR